MDSVGLEHIVELLAVWPHAFALGSTDECIEQGVDPDVASTALMLDGRFIWPEVDREAVRAALLRDPRLFPLSGNASEDGYFIPNATLMHWFVDLSKCLAQARLARLVRSQLSVLVRDMAPRYTPTMLDRLVDYGERWGFIARAWTHGHLVFPWARILMLGNATFIDLAPEFFDDDQVQSCLIGTPNDLLHRLSAHFRDRRVIGVVLRREGVLPAAGERARETLQEIGDDFGLTRERVRQIEEKGWKGFALPRLRLLLLKALLSGIVLQQGSLIVRGGSQDPRVIGFVAKALGIPCAELPDSSMVLGVETDVLRQLLSPSGFLDEIQVLSVDEVATILDCQGLCLSGADLRALAQIALSCWKRMLTRAQKVYVSLKSIGKPAHYSAVTRVYNSIFPDDPVSEHNVHAVLSRLGGSDSEQSGVVWVGIQGTYALEKWGYARPSKPLFDAVSEIVERVHAATGRPVPLSAIEAGLGTDRQIVNRNSVVVATQMNRRLRAVGANMFVPADPATGELGAGQVMDEDQLDAILRQFGERQSPCQE